MKHLVAGTLQVLRNHCCHYVFSHTVSPYRTRFSIRVRRPVSPLSHATSTHLAQFSKRNGVLGDRSLARVFLLPRALSPPRFSLLPHPHFPRSLQPASSGHSAPASGTETTALHLQPPGYTSELLRRIVPTPSVRPSQTHRQKQCHKCTARRTV